MDFEGESGLPKNHPIVLFLNEFGAPLVDIDVRDHLWALDGVMKAMIMTLESNPVLCDPFPRVICTRHRLLYRIFRRGAIDALSGEFARIIKRWVEPHIEI
jgi:hypothetical protein